MNSAGSSSLLEKLGALQIELSDLAFILERRGRLDAADLARELSGRITAVCDECAGELASGRVSVPPDGLSPE